VFDGVGFVHGKLPLFYHKVAAYWPM
jgi:hypothetical protein